MPKEILKSLSLSRRAKRWIVKSYLFALVAVVVLNPNLKRAAQQAQHTLNPESLIQTNFAGVASINRMIDKTLLQPGAHLSEWRAVEKFVLKQVRYASDYENWDNVEYWPTAEETWSKRQEDCDGRAILATSILRSRGYRSAKLAVGLTHMWVQVDANEKDPSKPRKIVALLNPERSLRLEIDGKPGALHFLRLAKAYLHPTAFRETSVDLLAEIPALRKVILVTTLLLLCYHPCRDRCGFLAVITVGLAATFLFDQGEAKGNAVEVWLGLVLFVCAIAGALDMNRASQQKLSSDSKEA